MIMLCYLISYKPYNDKLLNAIEIFNEICLLVGSYVLISFSDILLDANAKYNGGWLISSIIIFNLLVNQIVLFYKVFLAIFRFVKNKIR
jgi:hypothetical protein